MFVVVSRSWPNCMLRCEKCWRISQFVFRPKLLTQGSRIGCVRLLLQVGYDNTVRDGEGCVQQFLYGEDGVDTTQTK